MSPDELDTRVCPERHPQMAVVPLQRDDTHPPPNPANEQPQWLGQIPEWKNKHEHTHTKVDKKKKKIQQDQRSAQL